MEKFTILKKNDVLKENDKAYVIINSAQMQLTLSAFGHNEKISNKILIIGGGNIGFNLAKNIEQSFDKARIKIIEKDKSRAEFIANELNSITAVNKLSNIICYPLNAGSKNFFIPSRTFVQKISSEPLKLPTIFLRLSLSLRLTFVLAFFVIFFILSSPS